MTDPITPPDIVDVALKLLADGGLHALAMRLIASELGVQQSALYWHFDNKQQLLAAVADQIVTPVSTPADVGWSTRIEALATGLRSELLRYPDGAELVATTYAFRLGARQPFHQFTNELAAGGLALDDAEIAASVLLHFVLGYVTDEQQHDQAAALGAIKHTNDDNVTTSADDRFDRALHLIVAGIDTQIRATDTAGTKT